MRRRSGAAIDRDEDDIARWVERRSILVRNVILHEIDPDWQRRFGAGEARAVGFFWSCPTQTPL